MKTMIKYLGITMLSGFFVFLIGYMGMRKNVANAYACDWGYKSVENCFWAWDCMTTKLCDCTSVTNADEDGNNVPCIENQE